MSDRVLSSQSAKDSIQKIQTIITSGLTDQIKALDTEGRNLSEPNVWDGPLATTFRSDTWPSTHQSLQNTITKLTELNNNLQQISNDIFQAGGGA